MTEISAPCCGVPDRRVGNRTHVLLLALTLVAVLAGAFSSALVATAHAAPVVVIDENGANDEPNQKDLTRYSIDNAGLPASLAVTWNWDDITWSGNNTGDACALFDTDGDALVNYALCVTVGGSPASALSTRLYSCGDDRVDRCSQHVSEILAFSSTCSVSTTGNDPFPTGAASPNDTSASCNVAMSDFGLTTPALVNTCSYPSQEPNSDPSDCVLIPRDGFLIIQKNAVPDDATALFDFSLDGNAAFTAHGTETSQIIAVRSDITHSLSETMPSLWALQSASCSPTTGTSSGNGITGISVGSGETVTCTFNNAFVKASPTISTQASDAIDVGGSIHDTAALAGGFEPTGTITFQLFGPNDTQCASAISTTSVEVDGNGDYDSADVQPTQPGTYRWIASYSGDSNNDPVSGVCADENESVVVSKPAISLVKTVSAASVAPGETVTFTLTVTNTGDIALSNVTMTDDTCSPLSGPAGDTGSDSILDPAEIWTFTCSMVINQNTTNVATVTARDVHETTVTAQSSASVTVTPPSSPPPPSPATVRILSNNVCVSKRFRITPKVSSGTVKSMTLYVDGKRRATGNRHSFLINTAKYKPGRHRIRVVTTLTDGQQIITNGSFKRCGIKTTQRRVTPKFTG